VKAHQRQIREAESAQEPRTLPFTVADCRVLPIGRQAANRVILRYEWLGHMKGIVSAHYGLISPSGEVLGVAVFGQTANPRSGDVCGSDWRDRTICLRRGACVHYAPEHAASYLIARATARAHQDHGWSIFHAYADEDAGEIGTVYQACNWLYVGTHPSRPRFKPPGHAQKAIDERILRRDHKLTRAEAREKGWREIESKPKHRYVHFEGNRTLRRQLRFALDQNMTVQPYPKRGTADA
jgi:hypothetical protein